MAQEHTFDIVSKLDLQEVKNAVGQAMKEVRQRFDFKGSKCDIVFDEAEKKLDITAEDEMKLVSLDDLLKTRLVKRSLPLKAFEFGDSRPAAGSMLRRVVTLQQGIPTEKAKEIVKIIKGSKIRVQAAIQGDQLRISGKSLDDLQSVMRMLKETDLGIDMQFTNFR